MRVRVLISAAVAAWLAGPVAGQGLHDPSSNYFQAADSPFASLPFGPDWFVVEDFEDGVLDGPVASATNGVVLLRSDVNGDSVDGDDGTIDNNGNSGGVVTGAFYSAGAAALEFLFAPELPGGRLPTHVGLVMTDALQSSPITLTAFRDGVALGQVSGFQVAELINVCLEDRFYGFIDPIGIDRVILQSGLSTDYALDHLQFGRLPCIADLAPPFGVLDLADINAFVAGFGAMDPSADLNTDGLFDLSDISLFVTSFLTGCP
jgi:hypothetical protein